MPVVVGCFKVGDDLSGIRLKGDKIGLFVRHDLLTMSQFHQLRAYMAVIGGILTRELSLSFNVVCTTCLTSKSQRASGTSRCWCKREKFSPGLQMRDTKCWQLVHRILDGARLYPFYAFYAVCARG